MQKLNWLERSDGNVLFYILVGVALFAALTATLTSGGGETATATASMRVTEDIRTQAQSIRSAILECQLVYSGAPFPHANDPSRPAAIDIEARNITCDPNNSWASGDEVDLFGGTSGRFLPEQPRPFQDWRFQISADPVGSGTANLVISAGPTYAMDQGLLTGLQALERIFDSSELTVDYSTMTLTFLLRSNI